MENILEVKGLRKSYAGFSLQDIDFCLPEGCIVGFVGRNGAGKTTTLRTILGLRRKDAGKVRVFGMDMAAEPRQIKNRIGVILEESCFYEEFTADEMKGVIAPAYNNWCNEDYYKYMSGFNLPHKQKISAFSKGMKMKLALVMALSHKAELLILDEPTGGLDPLVRSELLEILQEYMAAGGRGVLFSTHITSDLDKVADMLIIIDNGRILLQENKDALLDNYCIVRGDKAELTAESRSLLLNIRESAFGFEALTSAEAEVRALAPSAVFERPDIEDIMVGLVKGGVK